MVAGFSSFWKDEEKPTTKDTKVTRGPRFNPSWLTFVSFVVSLLQGRRLQPPTVYVLIHGGRSLAILRYTGQVSACAPGK